MLQITRAIPQWAGQPEQFFDISKLPWKEQRDFKEELGQQGYYVQEVMLADPMHTLVSLEIRRKLEAETKLKGGVSE